MSSGKQARHAPEDTPPFERSRQPAPSREFPRPAPAPQPVREMHQALLHTLGG
ncbi:hypothetical protein ACNKHW_21360 [Shigella flexneri]